MGWMTAANLGTDGYTGDERCLTIAECLRPAGYATYMSGKWHLTCKTFIRQASRSEPMYPLSQAQGN
jgi:arylsulfatase A-like enzyme